MGINSQNARRGSLWRRPVAAFSRLVPLLTLALLPLAALAPVRAQNVIRTPEESRPKGLVIIQDTPTREGRRIVGVYAVTVDGKEPSLRQIKVWNELPNDVVVRTETIRCAPAGPMRITHDGTNLVMRELNPGGLITPFNRQDHRIWWTACFPEQANADPATLRPLALQLGYNGNLQEKETLLPSPSGR
ncbi:hypothetical protein [Cyanobium sp. Morenito 9A2]|uniref:hypothetical protein n=1 Tax=Cyanobium sp. Morenito 9A2 TaxID=2823718 RepID=UPI0020CBB0E8|nr:hypothetical protein [Cyanobium sp. Morenito 9A2]MCP9849963.1 hypothetical protein [Cyanobium sp. Morenito 9A2]